MSWRVSAGFAVTASTFVLSALNAPVRADDAYLCGPDTVVYVAAEDLEAKKHSDPCIAGYYGITLEPTAKSANTAAIKSAKSEAQPSKTSLAATLKPLTDSEIPSRVGPNLQRQASLEPPHATPGTDYRNVKVLNAETPESSWFRHTK